MYEIGNIKTTISIALQNSLQHPRKMNADASLFLEKEMKSIARAGEFHLRISELRTDRCARAHVSAAVAGWIGGLNDPVSRGIRFLWR